MQNLKGLGHLSMQESERFAQYIASKKDVKLAYKQRILYSDKYLNGKVVVIGGGTSYHGAPVLAATAAYNTLAALRVGAGYAITCVPKSIALAVRKISPNLIVRPLIGQYLNLQDLETLKTVTKRANSVVIGPGLGRYRETLDAVAEFIDYITASGKNLIVDADALYAVKRVKKLGKNVLITPNRYELRLFYPYKMLLTDLSSRIKAARIVANKLNSTVLLKGHKTVVSDGERVKVIPATSAALATMGTGDVLAGIIGGFAAMSKDMFDAAVAGTYVHTLIGDRLHRRMGDHIIATDVVDAIPKVIKEFDKH
jgi:hydroxyethylthiazole kinase-like uncharacterized protein yjeF